MLRSLAAWLIAEPQATGMRLKWGPGKFKSHPGVSIGALWSIQGLGWTLRPSPPLWRTPPPPSALSSSPLHSHLLSLLYPFYPTTPLPPPSLQLLSPTAYLPTSAANSLPRPAPPAIFANGVPQFIARVDPRVHFASCPLLLDSPPLWLNQPFVPPCLGRSERVSTRHVWRPHTYDTLLTHRLPHRFATPSHSPRLPDFATTQQSSRTAASSRPRATPLPRRPSLARPLRPPVTRSPSWHSNQLRPSRGAVSSVSVSPQARA